jgi:hypothetical protein
MYAFVIPDFFQIGKCSLQIGKKYKVWVGVFNIGILVTNN